MGGVRRSVDRGVCESVDDTGHRLAEDRATGRPCLQRGVREVEGRRPDRQVVQRQLCIAVPTARAGPGQAGQPVVRGREAREVVEALNRDAGYDPIYVGPIERAAAQEALVAIVFAISQGMGEFVYRMAPIEQV